MPAGNFYTVSGKGAELQMEKIERKKSGPLRVYFYELLCRQSVSPQAEEDNGNSPPKEEPGIQNRFWRMETNSGSSKTM